MSYRFSIGQKVRVYKCKRNPELVGLIGVVLDRKNGPSRNVITGKYANLKRYVLDTSPEGRLGHVGFAEQILVPYDPPTTWDQCAWKPREVSA